MGTRHRKRSGDADSPDPRINRTRSAVYAAGIAALYEHGPESITHAALAAATGMSRTTLYKHWPTRVELLVDICGQIEEGEAAELTGDVRTDLVAMVGEVAASLGEPQTRRVYSALIAQAQSDPEALEVSNALTGQGLADMTAVLEAGMADRQLPAGIDALEVSARLLGPLMFSSLVTHREVSPREIESIVDAWLASVQI